MFFEFPHFAGGAAAVGGRVHDDGVVEFAALLFAADEFEAVVGDVADGCVDEAAEDGVFFAPFDHALGGVDVGDARAGFGGGTRGGPGVAEEIEDVDRAAGGAGGFDFGGKPLPVDGLLGKKPGVLERRRVNFKRQPERIVGELPMIGEGFAVLPFAAALFAAVVEAVPVFPVGAGGRAVAGPDDLGIGADEVVGAPTLLF